mgnify:CR=1 FL=1
MEYLDFEEPIKELEDQLLKCQEIGTNSEVDVTAACNKIEDRLAELKKEIYTNLTPWQRVQVSRHPSRPYTLDYINALTQGSFLELHGDRTVKDDKAMIGGLGKIGDQSYMFIGQQKGYNTKTRQYRNFGMSNPEGYRKALRLMKSAEKFNIPVLIHSGEPKAFFDPVNKYNERWLHAKEKPNSFRPSDKYPSFDQVMYLSLIHI